MSGNLISGQNDINFDKAFEEYYINHNKEYKKYFRITNTKLINNHSDIFKIKNRFINVIPDKIDEAKELLKEYFDDLKNQKTWL